jgi:hypothetical protein
VAAPGASSPGHEAAILRRFSRGCTIDGRPRTLRLTLKLRGPQGRQGSNPCSGTTYAAAMSILALVIIAVVGVVIVVAVLLMVDR